MSHTRNPSQNIALVIAGILGWSYRSLFEIIRVSPYRDDIHVLGFVDGQDKPTLYSLAKLFVYPSFFEGFGFPPLEAMACGTPTMVSHTTSLPELVGDAAVLIDPLRLEEVARAMEEVLQDVQLRQHLRNIGFERVKKFQWEDTARETLKILENSVRN